MAARNPDFATLSEAAYEAAGDLSKHWSDCRACDRDTLCFKGDGLAKAFNDRTSKALKAIRGRKK